ncbi:MAG: histidine phosphatase family protein [Nocardioidaceae bacterium]
MISDDRGARQLVLVRHGRTPWNAIDRAQGHTDVQLDEHGLEQSVAAARVLALYAPVRLWTSDLARARQTAGCIEDVTGLRAEVDPRLREFDVGVRAGLSREEFAERYPDEYAAWAAGSPGPLVPGEETGGSVQARIGAALEDYLAALQPGQTGIVVTHGSALKVGLVAAIGWDAAVARSIKGMDNGAWAVLVADPDHDRPRLAAYNLLPRRRTPTADFASGEGVG